jgi:hypothetical protein
MSRLLLSCVVVISFAASAFAAEQSETKNAAIKFGGITSKPTKVEFGMTVKFEAELKPVDVNKTWGLGVGGRIENPTDKKIYFSYQIAFFDKDKNLVGCYNYTHWVDAHKNVLAGSFISLSAEQIDKITSYSAVFYESESQIGTK